MPRVFQALEDITSQRSRTPVRSKISWESFLCCEGRQPLFPYQMNVDTRQALLKTSVTASRRLKNIALVLRDRTIKRDQEMVASVMDCMENKRGVRSTEERRFRGHWGHVHMVD